MVEIEYIESDQEMKQKHYDNIIQQHKNYLKKEQQLQKLLDDKNKEYELYKDENNINEDYDKFQQLLKKINVPIRTYRKNSMTGGHALKFIQQRDNIKKILIHFANKQNPKNESIETMAEILHQTLDLLNDLLIYITKKNKHKINEKEIETMYDVLFHFNECYRELGQVCNYPMGTKDHFLLHPLQWVEHTGYSIAYMDDQRFERLHQEINSIDALYINIKGKEKFLHITKAANMNALTWKKEI